MTDTHQAVEGPLEREHDLKCHPGAYDAIERGLKTFEFRKDDRGYEVGDVLWLRRWDPSYLVNGAYTGASLRRRVTYILRQGFGVPPGYVVMSLDRLPAGGERSVRDLVAPTSENVEFYYDHVKDSRSQVWRLLRVISNRVEGLYAHEEATQGAETREGVLTREEVEAAGRWMETANPENVGPQALAEAQRLGMTLGAMAPIAYFLAWQKVRPSSSHPGAAADAGELREALRAILDTGWHNCAEHADCRCPFDAARAHLSRADASSRGMPPNTRTESARPCPKCGVEKYYGNEYVLCETCDPDGTQRARTPEAKEGGRG